MWVEQEPRQGFERPVEPGTIGREGCDVTLPDPDVSRHHATVRLLDNDSIAIEDLGSTNGTFVNEKKVRGITELNSGDRVRFGNTIWLLHDASGATRMAATTDGAPGLTRVRPAHASGPTGPSTPPTAPDRPEAPSPAADQAAARGDVPKPDDVAPSVVQRALPVQPPSVPDFGTGSRRVRGSAARRLEATVVSYAIVIGTAGAVVAYLAQR